MTTEPKQRLILGNSIGASQAAACLGLHPYCAPITVWRELIGDLPPFEGNAKTEWGNFAEPALRAWYVEEFQAAVHVPPESLFHAEHEWLRSTPDGIVVEIVEDDAEWKRGLELKTAGWQSAHRWGTPGTDQVPEEYIIQCLIGMAVTDLDSWDLAVSIGGEPPVAYHLERDMELESAIITALDDFWRINVLKKIPPEPDHTADFKSYLIKKFPNASQEYLESTPEIDALATELRAVRFAGIASKKEQGLLENQLREFIGDARGVITSEGRITNAPRVGQTSHKQVIEKLIDQLGLDEDEIDGMLETTRGDSTRSISVPRNWSKKP